MAEKVEKKKNTAKKSTTSTKKSTPKTTTKSTAKKATPKKGATKATATKATTKKATTTKKTTATKTATKTTAKKAATKTTAKKATTVVKKSTKGVKASNEKELKALITDKVVEPEVVEEVKVEEVKPEAKNEAKTVDVERAKKCERRVDIGILLLIIGLFGLLITLYLTSTMDLSHNITNGLVIGSMTLEVIGIIVILYNSFCK